MSSEPSTQYSFDSFRVDSRSASLYFDGKPVDGLNKKSVEVLTVLVKNAGEVVPHDEIIERVWGDNYHGITANNVAQYILRLRKTLEELTPGQNYIGTSPNRGYIFERKVERVESVGRAVAATANGGGSEVPRVPVLAEEDRVDIGSEERSPIATAPSSDRRSWKVLVPAAVIGLLVVGIAASTYFSQSDEDKVREVVRESQLWESLVLYRDPTAFNEAELDKYWTRELDLNLNYDRKSIRNGAKNLIEKGQYYGKETKCERFEFQSVEIDAAKTMATVRTLEQWFIAKYRNDDTLHENKTVGPYFVNYVVRNVDGRWLVEKSTTGRVNSPPPKLAEIVSPIEMTAGKQFFVRINGQDFLPELVSLKVVGDGCPDTSPCTVPNSALMKHSVMNATTLDNVPLTLGSGEYTIFAVNGNSPNSNPLTIVVPK